MKMEEMEEMKEGGATTAAARPASFVMYSSLLFVSSLVSSVCVGGDWDSLFFWVGKVENGGKFSSTNPFPASVKKPRLPPKYLAISTRRSPADKTFGTGGHREKRTERDGASAFSTERTTETDPRRSNEGERARERDERLATRGTSTAVAVSLRHCELVTSR